MLYDYNFKVFIGYMGGESLVIIFCLDIFAHIWSVLYTKLNIIQYIISEYISIIHHGETLVNVKTISWWNHYKRYIMRPILILSTADPKFDPSSDTSSYMVQYFVSL